MAESKEELFVIQNQIDRAQEDFKYFNIPGYLQRLNDLREQMQEKVNELNREICGS